jgi:hypothetical protein
MIDEHKIAEYTDAVSRSGKFENETVLTPYLYDSMMDGDGETLATGRDGDSATYFDISDDTDARGLADTAGCYRILLIQNSDGFCTLAPFDTESDARDAGEFYFGPSIEDDDITISDLNEIPAVVERMNREQFWPNVWLVNERGNTDLLSVNADTGHYEILKSWV